MLSKRKRRFLELAEKVSRLSNYRVKVGAVIVKNGNVVSVGFNRTFGGDKIIIYNGRKVRSIHAELMAIVHAETSLDGAEIFVFSKMKNGKWRLSRPCESCMSAIAEAGIKRVYYTTYEGKIKVEEV